MKMEHRTCMRGLSLRDDISGCDGGAQIAVCEDGYWCAGCVFGFRDRNPNDKRSTLVCLCVIFENSV